MADQMIKFTLPTIELGQNDLRFEAFVDGEKVGELRVSEGGLDWWPRGARTRKISKTWSQLRDLMEA
jgi:hypothetical protein